MSFIRKRVSITLKFKKKRVQHTNYFKNNFFFFRKCGQFYCLITYVKFLLNV